MSIDGNTSWLSLRTRLLGLVVGMLIAPQMVQAQLMPDPSLAPFPLSETFLLESLPGATKTIYIDFDGHNGYEGEYTAYSIDSDYGSFSDSEKTSIQLAWTAVAEDFLPFDVNVTTKDPGMEALRKLGVGDNAWGTRAVVSDSVWTYSWAYMDTFSGKQDYETFAYCGDVGTGPGVYGSDWIWVAESVSHEVGHTLGLQHDGEQPGDGEYWTGHGSGNTHYAPIMGWTKTDEPYGVSHWSKGEYNRATSHEDDLAIITDNAIGPANGFGYRDDDHGSDITTATAISPGAQAEGIIERNTDLDYFSFSLSGDGHVQFDINPARFAPNLDILAKIHASDGTVLFTSNPPDFLEAQFDVDLPAGDYFLSIDGTGYGDPATNGYSDYGSLGYYSIDLETTITPSYARADFDQDGDIDLADINALTAAGNLAAGVAVSDTNARFDLNGDSTIDTADLHQWLADAAASDGLSSPYRPGDTNLDADVDVWVLDGSGDAQVLSSNLGTVSTDAVWSDGDFNGDGDVDVFAIDGSGDAQQLSANLGSIITDIGGFQSSLPVTMVVPEPRTIAMLGVLAAIGLCRIYRRT